jgi:hypothetical protein
MHNPVLDKKNFSLRLVHSQIDEILELHQNITPVLIYMNSIEPYTSGLETGRPARWTGPAWPDPAQQDFSLGPGGPSFLSGPPGPTFL